MKVKDLSHVNYNPELSGHNIILEHDDNLDHFLTFRSYVKDYYEKENVQGRFYIDTTGKRATTTLCSFVVSGSRDFINSFENRDDLIEYFKEANEFLKSEYPDFHIVDSRIHFDEKGLPHMHTSFLPIVEKENHQKQFNVSKAQPTKNYFKGFQDRYWEHMKEKYPDRNLQRTDPNRDHNKKLTVKEYKEFKEIQKEFRERKERLADKIEQLKDLENKVANRDNELEKSFLYFNEIDRYCNQNGITQYQYQKEVFYYDKGYGSMPEPEKYNPERNEKEERQVIEKDITHER